MAHLTKSNSLRIIAQIDSKSFSNLSGDVYKTPIYSFSDYEKNKLLGVEMLFRDPERFINEFYKPVDSTDHLRYVYEGGKPAYHSSPDCDRLNSNFKNFEIPTEIKERGRDEVIRFREWFRKYQYLLEVPDIEAFTATLYSAFSIQINPRTIDYSNSGSEEKENLDLAELERRIDRVISDAGMFFNRSSDHVKIILRRFSKHTFLAYSSKDINHNNTGMADDDLRAFLKKYDTEYKIPIKNLLVEYYRVKHNPNLKFEGNLLEQLGFKPCALCYSTETDSEDTKPVEQKPNAYVRREPGPITFE